MAFQRTRRLASLGRSLRSLGSPLNAYPFGGRRLGWLVFAFGSVVVTVICVLTAGCLEAAGTPVAPGQSSTSPPLTATPVPQLVVVTVDEQGNEVPGATVAVIYQSPQGPRKVLCTTGNRGITAFRGIPAEAVRVLVTMTGFTDFAVPEIRLSSQQTTKVTATLKVSWKHGGITNEVPINPSGTPLWSPTPEPTATPTPADMRGVRCDPR
jgi:hypothetical protein